MKKAQISVPFQWIYVLIAGAAILILFVSFVARQRDSSELQLNAEVTQKLEQIFILTAQTTKTFNPAKMSPAELHFSCDADDVSEYWVNSGSAESLETIVAFSSAKIPVETQLDTWTWPVDMPFSVMNAIFLSSPTITTIVVHDDTALSQTLLLKIQDIPPQFNFQILSVDEFKNEASYSLSTPIVRVIYLTEIDQLPQRISEMPDENVILLQVESERSVAYYRKQGAQLISDPEDHVAILRAADPNPAFMGALFSHNAEYYKCTMRKILKRMTLLTEVYEKRATAMKQQYLLKGNQECALLIDPLIFRDYRETIDGCNFDQTCAAEISQASEQLEQRSTIISDRCTTLW